MLERYIIMAFGAILAIVGIVLFTKTGARGDNTVKMFAFEFRLSGSALVIFVVGCMIFLAPLLIPMQPSEPDLAERDTRMGGPGDEGEQRRGEMNPEGGDEGWPQRPRPDEAEVTPKDIEDVRVIVARRFGVRRPEVIEVRTAIWEQPFYQQWASPGDVLELEVTELIMMIEEDHRVNLEYDTDNRDLVAGTSVHSLAEALHRARQER